jgi:nucleotide-binding universal stress UspA family protein
MNELVVIGFDDSEHTAPSVAHAVREAQIREAPLLLVHAYRWIPQVALGVPMDTDPASQGAARGASTTLLEDAAERLRDEYPGLDVQTAPVEGDPPRALAEASREASLLVVGGRGSGGFTGLLLGSVALRVLPMAECPVMVVRGDPAPANGRIMVGVDLDAAGGSRDLLEFAFNEAILRDAGVYAIHVWEDAAYFYPTGAPGQRDHLAAVEAERLQRLDAVLEPWEQKYPGVMVSRQVFPGSAGKMLVESTRLVDALVVGGRARTEGHAGMRIGALTHTVLHHAHCPVIVVPEH